MTSHQDTIAKIADIVGRAARQRSWSERDATFVELGVLSAWAYESETIEWKEENGRGAWEYRNNSKASTAAGTFWAANERLEAMNDRVSELQSECLSVTDSRQGELMTRVALLYDKHIKADGETHPTVVIGFNGLRLWPEPEMAPRPRKSPNFLRKLGVAKPGKSNV